MLSDNLKRIREEQGYSKRQLAKETQISRRTIQLIEDNITSPNYQTIMSLAKTLNVPVEELIK